MLRNENHFAFDRFSLNLCKLSSLNVRIKIFLSVLRVRVASPKYAKMGQWSDKSFRIMPLRHYVQGC